MCHYFIIFIPFSIVQKHNMTSRERENAYFLYRKAEKGIVLIEHILSIQPSSELLVHINNNICCRGCFLVRFSKRLKIQGISRYDISHVEAIDSAQLYGLTFTRYDW